MAVDDEEQLKITWKRDVDGNSGGVVDARAFWWSCGRQGILVELWTPGYSGGVVDDRARIRLGLRVRRPAMLVCYCEGFDQA